MPGRLVLRGGAQAGAVFALDGEVCSIGRSAENDVVLRSSHISRRHAELRRDGDGYLLVDLGSKNGICVNGRPVGAPQPLADGDVISIPGADELSLAYEGDEETVTVRAGGRVESPIRIDARTAEVRVRGEPVSLTPKEYSGLTLLYEKGGGLVTKEEFAARVWPEFQGAVSDDSIEQVIYRLRRKLEANPVQPQHLLTVRGLGYRLVGT